MKKFILFLVAFCFGFTLFSQDIKTVLSYNKTKVYVIRVEEETQKDTAFHKYIETTIKTYDTIGVLSVSEKAKKFITSEIAKKFANSNFVQLSDSILQRKINIFGKNFCIERRLEIKNKMIEYTEKEPIIKSKSEQEKREKFGIFYIMFVLILISFSITLKKDTKTFLLLLFFMICLGVFLYFVVEKSFIIRISFWDYVLLETVLSLFFLVFFPRKKKYMTEETG